MRSSFSLVPLFLFFFLNGVVGHDNEFIDSTCKKAASGDPNLSYHFCVRALSSNPSTNITNVQGLGIVTTDLAIAKASSITLSIKNMLKYHDNVADANVKKCLNECLDVYSDAIVHLSAVKSAFLSNDYFTANIKMSAAMDASSECEEGLAGVENRVFASSLSKKNRNFLQLSTIALAVSNMNH